MAAVIGMGVLIVAGVSVLGVIVVQRMSGVAGPNASAAAAAAVLDEPAGTRIVGVSMAGDRLAVQLGGAGPDRVVVLDGRGQVVSRVGLAR